MWRFIPAAIGFWIGILFLMAIDYFAPPECIEGEQKDNLLLAVTLHNIPEGMAVAVPLISGGMSRTRAVLATALSGLPTVLGALIGYGIGEMGALGLALSLCFASGAMLYVVFGEILPQAILLYRSKLPAFSTLGGMMVGLLVIYM